MTRALLACWLAFAAGAAVAGAESASRLTLDEAVALALAHNRAIDRAEFAEQVAVDAVASARSRRYPSLSTELQVSRLLQPVEVTFPAGAFGTYAEIGSIPDTDATVVTDPGTSVLANVTLSQPLTGLIQANLSVRIAETARRMSEAETRTARLAVVRQARQTYFSIARAVSALAAGEASEQLLLEMERAVALRVSQKIQLAADLLDVQAQLARHHASQLEWRNAVRAGKEQLNFLMGRALDTEFEVEPVLEAVAMQVPADVEAAVARRPDVERARLQAEQADLAVRLARADRMPELGVLAQAIVPRNIEGAPREILAAGVQLTWEPFDWGRRTRELESRRLEALQAASARTEIEESARLEVARAARALEVAQAKLRAAELDRRTAQEQARVRLQQHAAKSALTADVLQAQAKLAESTTRYEQALLNLLSARADLDYAVGEELEP